MTDCAGSACLHVRDVLLDTYVASSDGKLQVLGHPIESLGLAATNAGPLELSQREWQWQQDRCSSPGDVCIA